MLLESWHEELPQRERKEAHGEYGEGKVLGGVQGGKGKVCWGGRGKEKV